jgi:hypothetical protein
VLGIWRRVDPQHVSEESFFITDGRRPLAGVGAVFDGLLPPQPESKAQAAAAPIVVGLNIMFT